MLQRLLFLSLIFTPLIAAAVDPTVAEMEALAKASYKRDSSYEIEAVKAFFGDGSPTRICAPPDKPAPEPFEIWLEILPDGSLGRTLFHPLTETAKCVKAQTAKRTFPKPPGKYVANIQLSFER
jgi:hypothetical protein